MIMGAIFVYFTFNIYLKVKTTMTYESKKNALLNEIEQLKQQEQSLKQEKANLENPEYILKYARGKYLLSKEGEQILRLPAKEQ